MNNENNVVKEYNKYGYIKYEGKYLNGLRNGEGKEFGIINYNLGKLIFEGEYLNGERNGKGKEYDDGLLIFEGEYFNNQRWNGKGKEYHYNGNIIYEGE